MGKNYQVRKAAGRYWLLDMGQKGLDYKKPVPLNETGATIWELLQKSDSIERAVEEFAKGYGVEKEAVLEDVMQFLEQLRQQGISIDGRIIDRRQQ